MFSEYEVVCLKASLLEHRLQAGARGTVLIVHKTDPPAYEVEFCDPAGLTLALLTLKDADLQSAAKDMGSF